MSYYSVITYDDYLAHHGILGQKWGVRRYQNADGTLTEAGKRKMDKIREKQSKKINSLYDHSNKWTTRKIDKLEWKNKKAKASAMKEMVDRNEKARKEKIQDLMNMNYTDFKKSKREDILDWYFGGQQYAESNNSHMTTFVSRLAEYDMQRGMRWASNFTFEKNLDRLGKDGSERYDYLRRKTIANASGRGNGVNVNVQFARS